MIYRWNNILCNHLIARMFVMCTSLKYLFSFRRTDDAMRFMFCWKKFAGWHHAIVLNSFTLHINEYLARVLEFILKFLHPSKMWNVTRKGSWWENVSGTCVFVTLFYQYWSFEYMFMVWGGSIYSFNDLFETKIWILINIPFKFFSSSRIVLIFSIHCLCLNTCVRLYGNNFFGLIHINSLSFLI